MCASLALPCAFECAVVRHRSLHAQWALCAASACASASMRHSARRHFVQHDRRCVGLRSMRKRTLGQRRGEQGDEARRVRGPAGVQRRDRLVRVHGHPKHPRGASPKHRGRYEPRPRGAFERRGQVRGAFDTLDRLCTTDQTAALEKWNTNVENSNWMTYHTAPVTAALCGLRRGRGASKPPFVPSHPPLPPTPPLRPLPTRI